MSTIIPYGHGRVEFYIYDVPDLMATIVPDTQLCEEEQRPFVAFSPFEIPEEDLEAILGYAGITSAHSPIGLPCDFEPLTLDRGRLLFPLSRLEAHLRETQSGVIAEYERHNSFEQFLQSRDMPAGYHLVAGLLECIKWCCKYRAAMRISW